MHGEQNIKKYIDTRTIRQKPCSIGWGVDCEVRSVTMLRDGLSGFEFWQRREIFFLFENV